MGKFTKIISVKTSRKKYKVYVKTFNSSMHFQNWMEATMSYGTKIIGTEDYPEKGMNDVYNVNFKK
jgi:hypothetical protein